MMMMCTEGDFKLTVLFFRSFPACNFESVQRERKGGDGARNPEWGIPQHALQIVKLCLELCKAKVVSKNIIHST